MAFITHLIHLNELQVNGQNIEDNDDFNVGEDETPTDAEQQAEAPTDVAQADAETETQDAEADQQQQETQPQAQQQEDLGDAEDNFTLDDAEPTDTPTEETTAEDNAPAEEAPADDTATNGGDEEIPEEGGDDDFTVDGGGEEGGDAEGGNEEGGEQPAQDQQQPAGKQAPADPTDGIDDDEDRAAEEAIYDTLTDDQKRIRVLQLKLDYKNLYETMMTTIDGVNRIPKNAENIETIKRLILLLTKAKKILIDYIEKNFDSNPYLENYTMYIKYMAVFRTASKVIEELNDVKDK